MSTYSTPIPGAPQYQQANLLARRAYENAMARYQQRRQRSLLNFGYTRGADGTLSVDPNNEYGQYQQMLRSQDIQSRRLDRAQRAGGWGTGSGYLGQQREDVGYAQGDEQRRLGTALADEMSSITQGETEAEYARDQALYQNELDAARDAIGDERFNPANYSGIDVPYGEGDDRPPPAPAPRRNVHQRGRSQLLRRAARRVRGRRR